MVMNREIKFRIWDEKYNTWDTHGAIILYANNSFRSQSRIYQQYIGMKDKNDKEIYEGDIVSYVERLDEHGDKAIYTGVITYNNRYAAWSISDSVLFSDYGVSNIEIIGNIFENPELLKV